MAPLSVPSMSRMWPPPPPRPAQMCFNMESSAAFALVGLFASYWIKSRTNNTALASGVFFFFTMEL
jgi:hypothetical protein